LVAIGGASETTTAISVKDPVRNGRNSNQNGKNINNANNNAKGKGSQNNNNNKGKGNAGGSSAVTTSAAAASTKAAASTGAASGNDGDAQTSLTLDPSVIATGFANNGQDVPEAGQVASLTSTNNFINYCKTVPNLPITNGKQITTGSCNPAPMGSIPSTDFMPSCAFQNPKNGDTIPQNTAFTVQMAVANFETGNFVNAQENYFAAPQQLNPGGQIIGHSHVVIEKLPSLDTTVPLDPKVFAFFKGLNAVAVNGVLTADVTSGLPAGFYKISSINTAANHQPVLVPIAQHASLDSVAYFTVSPNEGPSTPPPSSSVAVAAAAGTTSAAAASKTSAAARVAQVGSNKGKQAPPPPPKGGKQQKGGKKQQKGGKGRRHARSFF